MIYENNTSTRICLIKGDVRDATESHVVIGPNSELKSHYVQLTLSKFGPLNNLLIDPKVQICRDDNLAVIRNTHRPKFGLKHALSQAGQLQFAVETPMLLELTAAKRGAVTRFLIRSSMNSKTDATLRFVEARLAFESNCSLQSKNEGPLLFPKQI